MEYCCSVRGSYAQKYQTAIIKLQKKAARLILDREPRTSSAHLFQQVQSWLLFPERVHYHQATLVYKSINNLEPPYMKCLFNFNKDVYKHRTRSTTMGNLFIHPLGMPCLKCHKRNSCGNTASCGKTIHRISNRGHQITWYWKFVLQHDGDSQQTKV